MKGDGTLFRRHAIMSQRTLGLVLRQLRRTACPTLGAEPSDGQLLQRFTDERDESSFEMLVQRHGPMVWGLCRRMLANPSDAEDAFQATFLVLVRKPGSVVRLGSVGSWLYGVAYRTALDARARASRRRAHENEAASMYQDEAPTENAMSDVRQVLDEELHRLPEKYRAPLVLCYLQGKTNDEAADQLGWTRGTIAGRLSRARDLLRDRLTRRGLALSAGALATTLTEQTAPAAVPVALVSSTLDTAFRYAAGASPESAAPAVRLAEGVLHAMIPSKLRWVMAAVLALMVATAGFGALLHRPAEDPAKGQASADPSATAPEVKPAAVDPAQVKADRPAVVKGNTSFAFDLYGKLRTEKGNLFYSPYSMSAALAMTYAGAKEKTAEQMADVMHYGLEQPRLHASFAGLHQELNAGDPARRGYQLSTANALWGQQNYPFREEFLATIKSNYGGGLQSLDFDKDREGACKIINTWVEKQTQDRIKDLLKPSMLNDKTRLVLTNAIYFKGDWDSQFKKEATRDEPFLVTAADKPKVPLMHQTNQFKLFEGQDFQLLSMPYVKKDLSMVVLLPKKVDGLADLEQQLTPQKLEQWLASARDQRVVVTLPKFKITAELDLKDRLSDMGMPLAFDPDKADLTGMYDKVKAGGYNLYIAKVIHKAFVDVNEEGTEAAAATAVIVKENKSVQIDPVFRADHPFIFMIRDNRSGSVLFLGRLVDPRK